MRVIRSGFRFNTASLLPILCIALVLMSGVVQAAHFHVCAQPDHECTLCASVHQVARQTPCIELNCNWRAVEALLPGRVLERPHAAVFLRIASRPPPADLFLSA